MIVFTSIVKHYFEITTIFRKYEKNGKFLLHYMILKYPVSLIT